MTTTTQEIPQHLQALAIANETRLARAALKRSVAEGRTKVAQLVLDPPAVLKSARSSRASVTLADVLTWQNRWGDRKAKTFCCGLGISPGVGIHDLSETRRRQVARRLGV